MHWSCNNHLQQTCMFGVTRYQRQRLERELEAHQPVGVLAGVSTRKLEGGQLLWLQYFKSKYVCSSANSPDWPAFWVALRAKQREWKAKQKELETPVAKKGLAVYQNRLTFKAVNSIVAGALPGDITAAVLAEADHQEMFAAEPALRLASIQGKYGPWKSALFEAWLELRKHLEHQEHQEHQEDLSSRAMALFRVLCAAATLLHQVDYKVWDLHCGRHVAFHSGFLALLLDLRVICKPGSEATKGKRLDLSSASGRRPEYLLEKKPDLPHLQRYLQAADCLARHLEQPPRSCREFLDCYAKFKKDLHAIRAPHCLGDYTMPWTWRSACIARMRVLKLSF